MTTIELPESKASPDARAHARRVALFNPRGDVGRSTTAFHLGWALASAGHRVVLVDADPQCHLTSLVLGFAGRDQFEHFYRTEPGRNIRDALAPAFESQPAKSGPSNASPSSAIRICFCSRATCGCPSGN